MKSIKLTLDVIPVRLSNELIMGRLTRTIRFVSSQDSSSFDLFDTHPNFDENMVPDKCPSCMDGAKIDPEYDALEDARMKRMHGGTATYYKKFKV